MPGYHIQLTLGETFTFTKSASSSEEAMDLAKIDLIEVLDRRIQKAKETKDLGGLVTEFRLQRV